MARACAWISAATPATCGVAMDVPLNAAYLLSGIVDKILAPGAAISTEVFCELKIARSSVSVVAPTATTPS